MKTITSFFLLAPLLFVACQKNPIAAPTPASPDPVAANEDAIRKDLAKVDAYLDKVAAAFDDYKKCLDQSKSESSCVEKAQKVNEVSIDL